MSVFSVHVLLYKDRVDLARRCLDSIVRTADWARIKDLRLGLNEPTAALWDVAREALAATPVPAYTYRERNGGNARKYPLMRRMFHGGLPELTAPLVMWFDDDSHVTGDRSFWALAERHFFASRATVMGQPFTIRSRTGQPEGIRLQPWFGGRHVGPGHVFRFVTGGWWVASYAFLKEWDYPFKELWHNGGDSILGELVRQRRGNLVTYHAGVKVNDAPPGPNRTFWPWERSPEFYRSSGLGLPHQDFECLAEEGNRASVGTLR